MGITTEVCHALELKSGQERCSITNARGCGGEACAFYQTKETARAGREAASARLRSLSLDEQRYIADKYYGGKRPWKTKEVEI